MVRLHNPTGLMQGIVLLAQQNIIYSFQPLAFFFYHSRALPFFFFHSLSHFNLDLSIFLNLDSNSFIF